MLISKVKELEDVMRDRKINMLELMQTKWEGQGWRNREEGWDEVVLEWSNEKGRNGNHTFTHGE